MASSWDDGSFLYFLSVDFYQDARILAASGSELTVIFGTTYARESLSVEDEEDESEIEISYCTEIVLFTLCDGDAGKELRWKERLVRKAANRQEVNSPHRLLDMEPQQCITVAESARTDPPNYLALDWGTMPSGVRPRSADEIQSSGHLVGLQARLEESKWIVRTPPEGGGGLTVASIPIYHFCDNSRSSLCFMESCALQVGEDSGAVRTMIKFAGGRGFQDEAVADRTPPSSGKKKKKRQAKPTPKKDNFVRGKNRSCSL